MPNWTTNGIACPKDALKLFVNDEGNVDFNMMRPMPESLDITCGSIQRDAVKAARGASEDELNVYYPIRKDGLIGCSLPFDIENFDDLKRLGEIYLENERLYGSQTWYDWSIEHWGTKWNACDTNVEEYDDIAIVTFNTAWGAPDARMFDELFEKGGYAYYAESYDEDYGGIYTWDYGDGGLIFVETTYTDNWEDEEWEFSTGEYNPNVEALGKEVL